MNGFHPWKCLVVWFKRATGIGYREFPSLEDKKQRAADLRYNSNDLVVQVEQLERDIRRRGSMWQNGFE